MLCRQGNTVLHLAAGWGNVETVAMLLEVRRILLLIISTNFAHSSPAWAHNPRWSSIFCRSQRQAC